MKNGEKPAFKILVRTARDSDLNAYDFIGEQLCARKRMRRISSDFAGRHVDYEPFLSR